MPRPKEFVPDEVLSQAMVLFWERGYDATSIRDLEKRLGINRFSLYSTFGGKRRLFLAALRQYRRNVVVKRLTALERFCPGLEAVRRFFEEAVEINATKTNKLRGCLMTNTAVELGLQDEEIAAAAREHLKLLEQFFYRALLKARRDGEIRKDKSLRDLARFLTNAAQGLGVIFKVKPNRALGRSIAQVVLTAVQ